MKTTKWSPTDKKLVKELIREGKSTKEIAILLKTTPGAIRALCLRMGIRLDVRPLHSALTKNTVDEDRDRIRQKVQEAEHKAVQKKYLEVLEQQHLDDRVVDLFDQSIKEVYGDKFTINLKPFKKEFRGTSTPEEAVLVISDTHVGKIVKPEETSGFGFYNPLRYLAKLEHLEKTVCHIIQERNACPVGNPIHKLHIMLLGDLVDGMLNHSEEIPSHTYVTQQIHLATLSLFQSIGRMAQCVDEVVLYGCPGNHGRHANQRKMPTSGRFSNLDTVVLEWLQSLFAIAPIKNVSCRFERSLHQIIDILGIRICCTHGDELKGADRAMGIPVHAIARQINSMTQRLAARGEPVPRYYLCGDKHRRIELPTARGSFMINGSFVGQDGYSLAAGFSETLPEQLFFGIHPTYAKTWSYNLNVGDQMVPVRRLQELNFQFPESVMDDLAQF